MAKMKFHYQRGHKNKPFVTVNNKEQKIDWELIKERLINRAQSIADGNR